MKKEEFEARTKRHYTDDEFDVIDQIFDSISFIVFFSCRGGRTLQGVT